jgi:hypothetical protein
MIEAESATTSIQRVLRMLSPFFTASFHPSGLRPIPATKARIYLHHNGSASKKNKKKCRLPPPLHPPTRGLIRAIYLDDVFV